MNNEFNCLVAQSGGPTAAINASLAGVIGKALEKNEISTIYGAINGIQGVISDNLLNLTEVFANQECKLEQLKNSPAMYLGSCRYKLDSFDSNQTDYDTIFHTFEKYNIKYFFYIGGNDSMDTVWKLSEYGKSVDSEVRIIGIPKTIDNDLECIDHTPGFGSAAKYIASSTLEIAHDAYIYNTHSVTIIEIMGRNAGWLTAASALARNEYSGAPHLIYLPETPFSIERFVEDVKKNLFQRRHVVVAVSEGVKDSSGQYISARSERLDKFGHAMLSGTGKHLERVIQDTIGCKVRSVELNVLQRCASHIASLTDLNEAYALGSYGVDAAVEGQTAVMASLSRKAGQSYEVTYMTVPIENVANMEKKVPTEWISESGNDITEELAEYIRPLILGEASMNYQNGVPVYLTVGHLTSRK